MLDIVSLDEIEFIKPKKFTEIKKFTCSGKELEAILIIKDMIEHSRLIDFLKKNVNDPVSMIINLEYLAIIDVKLKKAKSVKSDNNNDIKQDSTKFDVRDVLAFIQLKLLEAIGPIADVILDDAISDIGESKNSFAPKRIPELINFVSREIPRDDKRKEFQKSMMVKLKELRMA
ncbi:MAG: hypothetical protein H6680_06815 [Desulfobacteraceae bacterium]|nr:hypothetical protein [Desulfobacteraceae bacterium]